MEKLRFAFYRERGFPESMELSAARLTEGLFAGHMLPVVLVLALQSLRHGFAVPPPFTQGRL
jgi:hypothetical protein